MRAENDALRQQLEDESHMRLRGEIRNLEQKLSAKHQQLIEQRDGSREEIKNLTDQRDKLQRMYDHLGREFKTLRESLPDDDEVRSLPDAAELLNAIRKRNPKLKLSLRDVEAIVEAMGD